MRPAIDMKQASEINKVREMGEEVCRLVMEYGGSMSGEHGDGIARGKFNKVLFDPISIRPSWKPSASSIRTTS